MTDREERARVTQADRDAAADLIEHYWSGADAGMMRVARSYREGHSQGLWVRAFASHRIAATERAAVIADEHGGEVAYAIAAAIRASECRA